VRQELADVVASLADKEEVSLDELAHAIGARAVSFDDVDAIIHALEASGKRVGSAAGGGGEERLRVLLPAARALREELGRPPTMDELALRTKMHRDRVRLTLLLAQVMGR
jgi:hypothetical protein